MRLLLLALLLAAACAQNSTVSPDALLQCGNGVLQVGEQCDEGGRLVTMDTTNEGFLWTNDAVCNGARFAATYRMETTSPYDFVGDPFNGGTFKFSYRTLTTPMTVVVPTVTYKIYCLNTVGPSITLILNPATGSPPTPYLRVEWLYNVDPGIDCSNYMIGTQTLSFQYAFWRLTSDSGTSTVLGGTPITDLLQASNLSPGTCCGWGLSDKCLITVPVIGLNCIEYPILIPPVVTTDYKCSAAGICTTTVSPSSTQTRSASQSPTQTRTASSSRTASRSRSQTRSISLSPSQTPSRTASRSLSSTRSVSRSPTVSQSVQPSPSLSPTMITHSTSPSVQPTPSETRSPNPTPSGTRSPNSTPSNSRTAGATHSTTRTPSNSRTPSSSASVGATPSTTPSPVVVPSPHPPQYDTGLTLGVLFGSVGGGLLVLVGVSLLFLLITYLRAPHRWVSVPHFRSNALDPGQQPEDLAALVDADL